MPADTLNQMILGFVVIFVILIAYILSLIIRIKQAREKIAISSEENRTT